MVLAQSSWLSMEGKETPARVPAPAFEMGLLPSEHGEAMKGFLYTGIYYMSGDLMRIKLEWLSKAGGKLLEFPNS